MNRSVLAASLVFALVMPATAHAAVLAQPLGIGLQAPAHPSWRPEVYHVGWRVTNDGHDWYIQKGGELGGSKVKMPDEKTARKTAKKFNKIEAEDGKGDDSGGSK